MARSYDLRPWTGVLCALALGVNVLVAGWLYIKKRRREAFQALVLPFAFWPTFLIAYAITDGSLGPFSSSKLLLAMLSVAIVVWASCFALIRALPWPAVPVDQLSDQDIAAITRRSRGLSLLLLACYGTIGGFGAFVIGWSLHFVPDIIAPGSGGSAQMLLAFFFVPVFLAGAVILVTGIAGATASWKHFRGSLAPNSALLTDAKLPPN